jgi:putative transposase
MAQLALDDVQRHPLAGEFKRVRVAQLVRREAPPDRSGGGESAELAADQDRPAPVVEVVLGERARGLGAPMLVVADGAPGLIKAIEQCWPASDRQRCCVHRARNLYAEVPERERERVRKADWQALDEAVNERDAKQRLQALVDDLDKRGYAAAAKCPADALDALVVHLRYPTRHRRRWRSTNLLERSLGEVKRRTTVIGRFPRRGQLPDPPLGRPRPRQHNETNGIRFTQLDRHHLNRIRYQAVEQTIPKEVNAA